MKANVSMLLVYIVFVIRFVNKPNLLFSGVSLSCEHLSGAPTR